MNDSILSDEQRWQKLDDFLRELAESDAIFIERHRAFEEAMRRIIEPEIEDARRRFDEKRKAVSSD